jgi:predicted dehydrogenase
MPEKPCKIRLAIIGCGIIASERHLPALQRLTDRFTVTALCNRTEPKAKAMAERLGLGNDSIWQDWRKVIEQDTVDAVLICLPIELNYQVSRAAISAGKHVLCEKPIGQSNEEAQAALGLGENHDVKYMVGENYHFVPSFAKAAHMVRRGAIGKTTVMIWNVMRFMGIHDKYNKTPWRPDHAYPGGYVLDGGVHYTHVLQMMAGRISSVSARTRSIEPGLGKPDTAFCLLTHENGVLTSLNLSWRAKDPMDHRLRICGTEGTILVDDKSLTMMDLEGKEEEVPLVQEDSIYLELIEFHRAVALGETPEISLESTAHDVEVILAVLESAEKESTVKL